MADTKPEQSIEKLAEIMAGFIVGWWPGLEDGIRGWGDDEDLSRNPVYQAALNTQKLLKQRREMAIARGSQA